MLKKVAITGGISSGKSTVCRILKQQGAYVVSADKIVHQLLSSNPSVKTKVIKLLGPEIKTGTRINRKKIARFVFANPEQLRALEKILHPFVKKEIKEIYKQIKHDSSYAFFAAEVPLLYEIKMENFFDFVIVVIARTKIATCRFIKKNKGTEQQFLSRIKRHLPFREKIKRADFTLFNNSTLSSLKKNLTPIMDQLKES